VSDRTAGVVIISTRATYLGPVEAAPPPGKDEFSHPLLKFGGEKKG
jgi:hypothetical protein